MENNLENVKVVAVNLRILMNNKFALGYAVSKINLSKKIDEWENMLGWMGRGKWFSAHFSFCKLQW